MAGSFHRYWKKNSQESQFVVLPLQHSRPLSATRLLPCCELHANCGWESSRRTRLAVTNRHRAKTGGAQRSHSHQIKKYIYLSAAAADVFSAQSVRSGCRCTLQSCWGGFFFYFISLPRSNWFLWLLPSRVMAPEQTAVGRAAGGKGWKPVRNMGTWAIARCGFPPRRSW